MNDTTAIPSPALAAAEAGAAQQPAVPAWFDADFYRAGNPDLAGTDDGAWEHFRDHGWREYRNPSATFDLWWYQAMHLEGDHRRDPVAHYARIGQAQGLQTSLAAGERLEVAAKTRFNLRTLALLEALDAPGTVFARIAANLARMQLWDVADMFAVRACDLQPGVAAHHALLGSIVARRNGWRRVVTALRTATALQDDRADWFHELGVACERLGWLDDAASAYTRALALDGCNTDTHYRLGRVEERRGHPQAAEACYARAIASDADAAVLGIGLWHEREKDWVGAECAYRQHLQQPGQADNAPLRFAHGRLLEMLHRWEEAVEAYRAALALQPSQPEWHYRHGWMLERLQRPADAAAAYARALALREDGDWRYRQGVCLHASGDTGAAIAAWLQCLPQEPQALPAADPDTARQRQAWSERLCIDRVDAHAHVELGQACERLGLDAEAAAAYHAAAARHDTHCPRLHYRLGVVLHRAGRDAEACLAFLDTRLFRRDFDLVPEDTANPAQSARDIKLEYAEFIETLPVRDEVVLYESFHGDSVSCNPLAVFRAARAHLAGRGMLHVWAVKPHAVIPPDLAAAPDVVFVRHGSPLYARYLATAGWLVNNNTFMPYFVRRPQQRYLNTWHGTPLKKLGADIPGALFDHKNAVRNLLQATHLAMPNAFTRQVLLGSMQVAEVIGGRIADTGQPRIDLMLGADAHARARIRQRLGLDADARIVLYAPTWRGSLDGASLDAELVSGAIARLAGHGAIVLFSGHHMVARKLGPLPEGAMPVPAGTDITELMAVVDVLVTDYSSILFDFLPSGRPVVLYVPDLEQYRRERGLYFDIDTLPVQACHTADALEQALSQALAARTPGHDDAARREAARQAYWPLEDGGSAARTVRFLFEGDTRHEVARPPRSKRTLLFQVGNFSPNGVTASFNRLAGSIDPSKMALTVIVDPWTLESYPQRMERFAELPAHVARWGRISFPVANREQAWLSTRQGSREVLNPRQMALLQTYYVREYARQFGSADFDAVVDFSGYAAFWTALFARGRPPGTRCVAYLHNDMEQEFRSRHPQLAKVFEQYPLCDALISVSDSLDAVNRRRFGPVPGQQADRFHSVDNCIDPAFIRRHAREPLPAGLADWRDGHVLLGTVGRLSPEKGHRRLLDAFAQVRRRHPRVRLVIVGEGPERPLLQQRITELGLEHDVLLTGALANPYPVMRALDLFVLSSHYEGQGIVLLEALTLGRPVLSTDIPGPRSVLGGGCGALVPDSTEGLAQGMGAWLEHPHVAAAWDAEAYSQRALAQFERAVAGIG